MAEGGQDHGKTLCFWWEENVIKHGLPLEVLYFCRICVRFSIFILFLKEVNQIEVTLMQFFQMIKGK